MKYLFLMINMLIFLSITSCGTVGSRISGNYEFDKSSDLGLIVISSSVYDKCGGSKNVITNIYNSNGTGMAIPIYAKLLFHSPEFTNPDGHFFVIEIPSGNYEFSNLKITGLTISARHGAVNKHNAFTVEPNKIKYIGELEYTLNRDCYNYSYKINNNWHRDKILFANRIKNINPNTVKVQIASSKKYK